MAAVYVLHNIEYLIYKGFPKSCCDFTLPIKRLYVGGDRKALVVI